MKRETVGDVILQVDNIWKEFFNKKDSTLLQSCLKQLLPFYKRIANHFIDFKPMYEGLQKQYLDLVNKRNKLL